MRNITILLDRDLDQVLTKVCRLYKRKRSEVVQDALRRQLSVMTFEHMGHNAMPFAKVRGPSVGYLLGEEKGVISLETNGRVDQAESG